MNNKQKMFDTSQRFGFRKLTVGLASVLIGLTFMTGAGLVHSDTVHADTVTAQDDGDTEIPDEPANPGDDIHEQVGYEAQDQNQTVHYKNPDGSDATNPGDSKVPDTTITGPTDSHVATPIPGGWKDHDPASHTNDTIPRPDDNGNVPDKNVAIDHDETTITHDHPATPGNKIPAGDNNPNTPNDHTFPNDTKAQKDNLNGTAHRHIIVETPDHKDENSRTNQTIDQTINYNRDAKVDTVTGEVNSYTPWKATDSTKNKFDEYHVDHVDGYDISVEGATKGTDYVVNGDGSITINANTPDPTTFANSVTDFDPTKTKVLPNHTITVKYTAAKKTVTIHYVDDDNGGQPARDAQDKTIDVVTDQNLDGNQLTYNVPSIYHLADNSGEVTTFHVHANDQDNVITVHLKQNTGVPIDPDQIPDGTKNPEDSGNPINKDEFTHNVTRTVNVTYPASYTGEKPNLTQTMTLKRTATYNMVTGVVTWGAWSTGKFDAKTPVAIAGYTPSVSSIAEMPVDINTKDQTVNITYSAGQQNMTWTFVDDDESGKTVGSPITLTGDTDTSISTGDLAKKLAIPENYELDDTYTNTDATNVNQIPTSFTFHATNTPVTIHLKHHHQDIDASHIPHGAKDKDDQHDIKANDFSKNIKRIIEFETPTHQSSTSFNTGAIAVHHDQQVTLQRHGDYDAVTGLVTWKAWDEANFDAVNVGKGGINAFYGYDIDPAKSVGYDKENHRVDAMHVTSDTKPSVVIIRYKAQDHKVTYHFVDGDGNQQKNPDENLIPDVVASGKTDDTVNTPKLPDGWVLDGDTLDSTVKVPSADKTVNVKIKHGQVTVTHDNPVHNGDKISGTTNKTYGDGLTQNDLNQQGTRTIVFNFPKTYSLDDAKKILGNGDKYTQVTYDETAHTATVIQTVHFTRDAIVDTVTGKVIEYKGAKEFTNSKTGEKSPWDSDPANGRYAAVKIPKISGYKSKLEHVKDETQVIGRGTRRRLNFAKYYMVNFMALPSKPGSKVPSEPAKTPDTNPGDATHVDKPGEVDNKGNQGNKGQDQGNKGQDQGGQKTDDHKGQDQGGQKTDDHKGQDQGGQKTDDHKGQDQDGQKADDHKGQDQGGQKTDDHKGQTTDNTQKPAEKPSDNKNDEKPADNTQKPNENTSKGNDVNSTDHKFDGKKSGNDRDVKKSSKKSAKTVVNTTKKTALNGNGKGITNMVTTVSTTGKASDGVAPEGNVANADNGEGAGVHTAQAATVNGLAKDLPQTGEKQGMIASIFGALASGLGILGLIGAKRKKKED